MKKKGGWCIEEGPQNPCHHGHDSGRAGAAVLCGRAHHRVAVRERGARGAVGKFLRALLGIAVVFGLGFGAGYGCFRRGQLQNAIPVETDPARLGLRMPGEVEKRVVTRDEVAAKLAEIGQLAVYMGEYTVEKSVDHTRFFLDDIPIPGTTNTIHLECGGVVKVGYEIAAIVPAVDNDSRKIYIALPEAAVLDNYIIWDTIRCTETNNILNPIDFAQYQTLIGEIEQEGLAKAEEAGIYDAAQANAKLLIQNFLAGFEGFEVVFLE